MKGVFLILIFIIFSSQNQFAQDDLNKFTNPDTLEIELFDKHGCLASIYTLISIRYYDGKGIIYSYNIRDYVPYYPGRTVNYTYLRRGYFDKDVSSRLIELLAQFRIDSILNNQIDTNVREFSTGDGKGTFYLYLKKGNKNYKKSIIYPKPIQGRILDSAFEDLYKKINEISIELTEDIPLDELLELYESPPDVNIKKKFIENAIANVNDTSKIDDLIKLFNSDKYEFKFSILHAFEKMDNDKIILFIGTLIDQSIKENESDFYFHKLPKIIANISNDSVKVFYLKRCLLINDKNVQYYAARQLTHLKEASGIDILLSELDNYNYGSTSSSIRALVELDNKSVIFKIIEKYSGIKNNDSIPVYRKKGIIGIYLFGLNNLLGVESKEDYSVGNYENSINQEMADIEIEIDKYLKSKGK